MGSARPPIDFIRRNLLLMGLLSNLLVIQLRTLSVCLFSRFLVILRETGPGHLSPLGFRFGACEIREFHQFRNQGMIVPEPYRSDLSSRSLLLASGERVFSGRMKCRKTPLRCYYPIRC